MESELLSQMSNQYIEYALKKIYHKVNNIYLINFFLLKQNL